MSSRTHDKGEPEHIETVVVGAGQAGLSVGYHLKRRGLPFAILDANERVGDSWRARWDSLRLFSPARHNRLDGLPFPSARHSFPSKDEMADYLESYAARFELPVRDRGQGRQALARGQRLRRHGGRSALRGRQRRGGDVELAEASVAGLRRRARPGHRAAALRRLSQSLPAA